jgi:hypothetical protein
VFPADVEVLVLNHRTLFTCPRHRGYVYVFMFADVLHVRSDESWILTAACAIAAASLVIVLELVARHDNDLQKPRMGMMMVMMM